jgi:pimeloyl-ACP methyl ester carboxylesterase
MPGLGPGAQPPPPVNRGGSGPPLLLLHGGGGTWRLWEPAIPFLEPHRDVLAATLPGHWGGPPIPPRGPGGIEALADGVERVMDEAGFDRPHIAGGSLGGWVALELARRGRARSVVAVAPAGGWRKGGLEWWTLEWMYRVLLAGARVLERRSRSLGRRPRLRRLLLFHHFARTERMKPEYFEHVIVGAAHCPGFDSFVAWGRQRGGAHGLEEIRCPVLLAFPERDLVLPRRRYGERLVDALEHAQVIELRGVGHVAMADDPELVAQTILDFTRQHQAE